MKWYRNKYSGKCKQFPDGWLDANTGKGQVNSNWEEATQEELNEFFKEIEKEEEPKEETKKPKVVGGKITAISDDISVNNIKTKTQQEETKKGNNPTVETTIEEEQDGISSTQSLKVTAKKY